MTELPPGSTIGILGGGQLGRMLSVAASRLGFRCHIYEPGANPPAGQVADRSGDMHLAFFVPLAGYLLLTAFALVCSRWRGAEGQAAPVASPH